MFEVILSVAIFAGAAAFTLGCIRSVFIALDRTRREQEAVDLARSRLAELEAGLITLADLRGQSVDAIGSMDDGSSTASITGIAPKWSVDVKTHRTEFTGLSLVELTVREAPSVGALINDDAMSFTLRQLMPLRPGEAEEFQSDELTESLPTDVEPAKAVRP